METTATAPQHMKALEKANQVRVARAELKRQIERGQVVAVDVILDLPAETRTMEVFDLLMSQPRWGKTRSRRLLISVDIVETKQIGSMSRRQRLELAKRLTGDDQDQRRAEFERRIETSMPIEETPAPLPPAPTPDVIDVTTRARDAVQRARESLAAQPTSSTSAPPAATQRPSSRPKAGGGSTHSRTSWAPTRGSGVHVPKDVEMRPEFREHSGVPIVDRPRHNPPVPVAA